MIGPGTGLGVGGLLPVGGRWQPIPGEGGHASLAPQDAVEDAILAHLRQRFGHVSAERVLSGPGLVNLATALAAVVGACDGDLPVRVLLDAVAHLLATDADALAAEVLPRIRDLAREGYLLDAGA